MSLKTGSVCGQSQFWRALDALNIDIICAPEKRKVFLTEPITPGHLRGDASQCLAMALTERHVRFGARGTPPNPLRLQPRCRAVVGDQAWMASDRPAHGGSVRRR
jgi:hypothetical protein